jgi:hypothetical protein
MSSGIRFASRARRGTEWTAASAFSGSVINNTDAPIAFQLTGGPVPFEPFVASFQNGIGPRPSDLKAAPISQASKTLWVQLRTALLFTASRYRVPVCSRSEFG